MATAFDAAFAAMRQRVLETASSALPGFPHYADQTTGAWTTTPDAFWTGGFSFAPEKWTPSAAHRPVHDQSFANAAVGIS